MIRPFRTGSRGALTLLAFLVLAAIPFVAPQFGLDYYVGFIRRVLIIGLAAMGMNFLLGQCGLIAIGYASFMGVGAFAMAVAGDAGITSVWLCLATAAAAAAIVGALVGAVALRATGLYFIMITLAFAQMLTTLAVSLPFYGGDDGYTLPGRPQLGFGFDLADDATFYGFVLVLFGLCMILIDRVTKARFGQAMRGIAENETRMQALGFPVYRLKLVAFSGTSALAGVAGALLAANNGFVSPSLMSISQSLMLMVMVFIGGLGLLWGAPVGVAVWMVGQEILQSQTEYWRWPIGVLLLFCVFVLPGGIASQQRGGWRRGGRDAS